MTIIHRSLQTLSPDNKVYQLIQQRIQDQLMEVVKRRQLKEREVLIQQGLVEVEQEILELGERIRALVNHNKAVYAKVYNQIVDMQNAAAAATLSMAASSTAPVAPQNGDGSASTQ